MKWAVVFFILLIIVPLVHSLSLKDLISRYIFSAATQQMNVTSFSDFMIDKNNNGINDTLVFGLTTVNVNGNFIFVINLFDKDGTITNETNKTLNAGTNKINITFSSILLNQNQYNYSIKVYNSSHSLKYRKDNISTKVYISYEGGFSIIKIKDSKIGKTLQINATINSPINGTHTTALFLSYNNSVIFLKEEKQIKNSINNLLFNFGNETIKRTHFIGNFTISSLKVGIKTIKVNTTSSFYDFRNFAATSYIYNFTDKVIDADDNDKSDFLEINTGTEIMNEDNYTIAIALYDLFGNAIELKNTSSYLYAGKNAIPIDFNGSLIYSKKLNGPYAVKSIKLFENGTMIDDISDAHTTSNYNFNDFEKPAMPDLKAGISVSDGYHYGIDNITVNFTFKNTGKKHAFNVFAEIFDNKTFLQNSTFNIFNADSQIAYEFNFTNISDFEISAIADLQDFVEELNESNNAEKIVIKLNKKPVLATVINLTVNETGRILINLSALDPNGDGISYSINLSKFSNNSNIFEWNTTTMDSGEYFLKASASDGFLKDFSEFKISVLDTPEIDFDNDGINDSLDNLIGDESSVNTSTINLSIFLDDSRNLSRLFNESKKVKFRDGNSTIAEFDFDFSKFKLNFTNLKMNKQSNNSTGSLIVKGLELPSGLTKTLYVDRLDSAINGICIKEAEIGSITEISTNCGQNDEFKVECDGTSQNSYICAFNSTMNKYKIQGLRHSGILQIDYVQPQSSSSGSSASASSGDSGGGSDLTCISAWKCGEWSQCMNGIKNRKCTDESHCTFPNNKPAESKGCGENQKSSAAENSLNPTATSGNFENNLKELSNDFASITGKSIEKIPKNKSSSMVITVIGFLFLIVGYFVIIRYQKIN